MLREKRLDRLVDPELQSNYEETEVEELIQVALLCTMHFVLYLMHIPPIYFPIFY